MLGRLPYFPDLFLSTLGLLRRGDRDIEGLLLRRRRGLVLLFLAGGLPLRRLAYFRGGESDRLWESDEGLGEIRRRLAGGGLRLLLTSLKRRSLSRGGGVRDGDRGLRRLGSGERVTEREARRRGGLDLRDGDSRLLVGGKGERERERELLLREEEGRRGDGLYPRVGGGEREPRGVIDRERRRCGEPRRRFCFH